MHKLWHFSKKRKADKNREAMQAEFFADTSIDNDIHALIREGIQNSLDAEISPDEPIRIRLYSSGAAAAIPAASVTRWIGEDAWRHFCAMDSGVMGASCAESACQFLVYEDFNTHGLNGDIRQFDDRPNQKNSFYYFLRAEGQSSKSTSDRGRWGIGKFVFPKASRIRTYFALTERSEDGKRYLVGQSILKYHHVDNTCYLPDGWMGEVCGNGDETETLPISDEALIEDFKSLFSVSRKTGQTGLSVVVPYVSDGLTLQSMMMSVIKEYFFPIMKGKLVVELSVLGDGVVISKESIEDLVLNFASKDPSLEALIQIAKKALAMADADLIVLGGGGGAPRWSKVSISAEQVGRARRALEQDGDIVGIRVPLAVQKVGSKAVESFFDMYLCACSEIESAGRPTYIREGILIPQLQALRTPGYQSLVIIDPGCLATMLGDAENPAHTQWEKNSSKFRDKYENGPSTISFMNSCASSFLRLLSQKDEEADQFVLSDLFAAPIPDPQAQGKGGQVGTKSGNKSTPPKVDIPRAPRSFLLERRAGGFCFRSSEVALDASRRLEFRVAYDTARGNPFKRWAVSDFDLSSTDVSFEIDGSAKEILRRGNVAAFRIGPGPFRIEVSGFDQNRDVIVEAKTREVEDDDTQI